MNNIEGNIWKLYLFEILYSFMFYTPIIVLFLQKNGVSLTEVMLIQSINSIIWIAMEIPSGYFADVTGRKISLMITGIFATLSMLIYSDAADCWRGFFDTNQEKLTAL